jgi:hypothetical protein
MATYVTSLMALSDLLQGYDITTDKVRALKHVGRQHDDDGNQYNESMKINK